MPRKRKPEWTRVILNIPKKSQGFWCWGDGTKQSFHRTNEGEVWICDKCSGRAHVCAEHWEQHTLFHSVEELQGRYKERPWSWYARHHPAILPEDS
jgi:hypothetical protein